MPAITRSNKGGGRGSPAAQKVKGKKPYQRAQQPDVDSPTVETDPSSSTTNGSPPLFFWREKDSSTGWLSQWYQCDFTDEDGVVYKSAEHYMMYQKALLFSDPTTAGSILAASHPREVKALGRKVANFNDDIWRAHREAIVRRGTVLKFTRAVSEDGLRLGMSEDAPLVAPLSLRELLLGTGDREIVEASPLDRIWGVGFSPAKAETNRARWGLNLLGKALASVRDEFRKEEEEKS